MQQAELIRQIERVAAGGLDQRRAQRALSATLATLAECLPEDIAGELAAQLPREAQGHLLRAAGPPHALTLEQFAQRVAAREELSPSEAIEDARAVLDAVAHAVTGHELQDVRTHLPAELGKLFAAPAAARWPETHSRRPHA